MAERESDKKMSIHRKALFAGLSRKIKSNSVLQAMLRVPRETFIPVEQRHMAYLDMPLPIGEGQTISQPYIVALITEALRLQPADKVLEVGAGSGYQAAVLSELVPEGSVVTVEAIPSLARRARETLCELGYKNVIVEDASQELGCSSRGPYDAIVVSAAAPGLAPALVSQLAVGGRMVVPVGSLHPFSERSGPFNIPS
jgi:protein-L-isoaspartate(D-aspartate) O-methyltransferase